MNEHLERLLKVNVEWLEENKSNADLQEYASVATATAQIVVQLGGQKETAVGAAAENEKAVFGEVTTGLRGNKHYEITKEILNVFHKNGNLIRDAFIVLEQVKNLLGYTPV